MTLYFIKYVISDLIHIEPNTISEPIVRFVCISDKIQASPHEQKKIYIYQECIPQTTLNERLRKWKNYSLDIYIKHTLQQAGASLIGWAVCQGVVVPLREQCISQCGSNVITLYKLGVTEAGGAKQIDDILLLLQRHY